MAKRIRSAALILLAAVAAPTMSAAEFNPASAYRESDAVAQRYWGDAVLLPTVSNTPRTTPAMVRDYFVHFLEKHPRGRIDSRSIQIGCNLAIDMGTYTFSVLGATGAPGEVAARYTYVYAFRDGEWKILHHHSSAMPEVLAAPATTATAQAGGAANGHDEAQTAKPEATAGDRKTRLASAEPKREPPPLDRTRMFLNTEASPQVMEYYPAEARARRETGRVALHVCADPACARTSIVSASVIRGAGVLAARFGAAAFFAACTVAGMAAEPSAAAGRLSSAIAASTPGVRLARAEGPIAGALPHADRHCFTAVGRDL